jgi:hypothetical protein
MSIFDPGPYPWDEPEAEELWRKLYRVIDNPHRAMLIAARIGLDIGRVNWRQASTEVWQEILNLAANSSAMPRLVDVLLEDKNVKVLHEFLRELLRAAPAAPAARQLDSPSEQEALLYHDDLTLPAGRVAWLTTVLHRMQELAPAVCRIESSYRNGQPQIGTAFRIAPDSLLTNWHVLIQRDTGVSPIAVVAEFGYDTDAENNPVSATLIRCRIDTIRTDENDDWGVIRFDPATLPPNVPIIDPRTPPEPVMHQPVFIIQHPQGGRKRLAYVRNPITYFDERVIQYITDTQVGSSGSPVFDEHGHLIAYHRAGGKPQEFAGGPPVKKNEGIRISRILPALRQAGILA